MTISDAIINRLKQICKEKKITVNRLSTLSGITQSTLNSLFSGKAKNPNLRTLWRISVGLEMTVSQLLDFPEMNEMRFEDE